MTENNKYSNLTLDELVAKKTVLSKRKKIYTIIAILFVLNTLFAVYKKNIGFFHSITILVSLFFMAYNDNELKKIELEILIRKK